MPLSLHVTGGSHSLGDVQPEESRRVKVTPTGASHVEISFIDDQGQAVRLKAGGYFEPGYVGKIDIAVQDGKVY